MSEKPYRGLGTLLRHLLELLDGEVQRAYDDLGIDYRPRYTPVVRALMAGEPKSLRAIANHSGLTHSAVSQTVAEMKRVGLVRVTSGADDARSRVVRFSDKCRELLPALERQWSATNRAAERLDGELSSSLRAVVVEAIAALEEKPFHSRIASCMPRKRP